MEKTFVILKPDAVKRNLIGKITSRFEEKGLRLLAMKLCNLTPEILKEHYSHIADKPFFPGTVKFMTSAPVVIQCWQGLDAVQVVRDMCGVTNARKALPGTIRGDMAMSIGCNLVHSSENIEIAGQEVARFFQESDFCVYQDTPAVYSEDEK
ncbi:MAG TPA: nucleoside-diphosphate kinase [Candidatus Gracilibacteria bacterium]|nr:nucleoside-diphosphate kinase [Candidatus Gracilibacteria bacterium]